MQSFTEAFNLDQKGKQLELNIPNRPKVGFIASRMNKDNFWNLVFWLLPSGVIFLVQLLVDIVPGGNILLFASMILSPYLISKLNAVEYRNNEFHSNSTNRKLGTYAPKYLGFILWLAIPFTAFWILLLHSKMRQLDENFAVYNLIFWFVPVMYFILRDLPISIVFNKITWTKGDGTVSYSSSGGFYSSNQYFHNKNTGPSTGNDSIAFVHDYAYRHLNCNIHHRS